MIARVFMTGALLALSAAWGQPPERALSELEATERRASDKTASSREREQAADKALELRAQLIATASDDEPRLTEWLVAQGAAKLSRLGRDGSDTAVLFGIALPPQRDSVRQSAEESLALLTRAGAIAERRWKSLTDASTPPDDPKLAQAEQDKSVRVPFFAARARVLLAAGTKGKERVAHGQAAFELVGKLTLSGAGPEAIRRVSLGAALLMKADPPEAVDLQSALEEFGWVLTGGAGGQASQAVASTTRAEAWFGLVHAAAGLGKLDAILGQLRPAMQREPFVGADGKPDALLIVQCADAVARAWLESGVRAKDPERVRRAADELMALLARADLGFRSESLRPLVFQKLAHMAQQVTGELPSAMELAVAIEAVKEPSRRAEALQRLQRVAAGSDPQAADALWELAVVLTQGSPSREDRLAACVALTSLASRFSGDARASDALSAALAYAQALSREEGPGKRDGDAAYLAALKLATSRYAKLAGIDTWRYELARVNGDGPERVTAIGVLMLVSPESSIAADALKLWERLECAELDHRREGVRDARRTGDAARVATESYLPEARRAEEFARVRRSELLDRFRADLAEAMTDSLDTGGRAIFEDLLKRSVAVPGGASRLRLGLARSLLLAGDSAAAFSLLRDLATALDAPPAGGAPNSRPEAFWFAWTLMLEELGSKNQDGARTGTVRAHIRRLQAIDKDLGGAPWKSRIESVAAKLKD